MCDRLRQEFRLANFGFEHESPVAFVTAQWKWHPAAFITFRVVAALYTAVCYLYLVTMFSIHPGVHNIMAFLTMWTYLVLTIYMCWSAIIAIVSWRHAYRKYVQNTQTLSRTNESICVTVDGVVSQAFEKDPDQKDLPISESKSYDWKTEKTLQLSDTDCHNLTMKWYLKVMWLLADVEYVFCLVVSIIYFTALFPMIGKTNINDLNMHAFNTITILIDVFIVARPFRLLHVIYPTVYGLCYIVFSIVYWHQDPEVNVLYPGVLDWNHPYVTAGIVVAISLIFLPLMQLFHFGLFRLRLAAYKRLYGVGYDHVS